MRIAIYHNLPSGGGKRALFEMTQRLAERHNVDVITLSTAEHDFCDLRPHCNRHVVFPFRPLPLTHRPFGRLNQGIRSLDLLRLRALQRQIAARIDAANYDVVFAHNCQYGQSPSLLRFLQTPSVYYCQEPPRQHYEPAIDRPYTRFSRAQSLGNWIDPFPGLFHKTLTAMDRRNTCAPQRVLVNSAYSRESLYRVYGIFANICYLGVDTGHFRHLSLPKQNMVVSVGALVPTKGFDFLLHSLAYVKDHCCPKLVVASNYTDREELVYLMNLAERLGLEAEFRQQISDEELVTLYNQANLTLYAPIMEPFGFVPLESMACGTPVVGVREGGVRESVIHGTTGLLTERDPQKFASAIEDLLTHPKLIDRLGKQGMRWVEETWKWDVTVEQLEAHLRAVARQ